MIDNRMMNLPKQLLRVEDLTFQLPDDFEGDIKSALCLLVEYLNDIFGDSDINPTKMKELKTTIEEESFAKVTMNFGIFELRDGKYYLK